MSRHTSVLLVRPRYPYGKSQIYMPSDLIRVAAMIQTTGVNAEILDLNLHKLPSEKELRKYDAIGVGVVGPPYIPQSRKVVQEITDRSSAKVFVGGQVISHLNSDQFRRIYGEKAVQIKGDSDLGALIGSEVSPAQKTSIVGVLHNLDEADLRLYLEREFSTFVSQGCKYNCRFCAAPKAQSEQRSDSVVLEEELNEIAKLLRRFNFPTLKTYLSPLDLFQNPTDIAQTLEIFIRVSRNMGVGLQLRGLSRVDSFLEAFEKIPQLRNLVADAKLRTVGFGIDGTSERIWRLQRKAQTNLSEVERALDLCREVGISSELLMVVGFHSDTFESLFRTYLYTVARSLTHGSVARPYLAKEFVPGNDNWIGGQVVTLSRIKPKDTKARVLSSPFESQIEKLLVDPELFANLDYAALGSVITHPNLRNRILANLTYLALIATLEPFGKNTTYPLVPKISGDGAFARFSNSLASLVNNLMPFDR